jgi:hypothetical protein
MNLMNYFKIIVALFGIFAISCDDILEKDISKKHVQILAPPNGLVTSIATQTFWWQKVDGAGFYNLQIVKGEFNYITQLVLDTLIKDNRYIYSLNPGTYQWQVKAVNNDSETEFSTHTLVIDSSSSLTGITVILNLPLNNIVTNDNSIYFEWQSLYSADAYRFQIKDNSGIILFDTLTASNTIAKDFNTDGIYTWQVRAENSSSLTNYSSRILEFDETPPLEPYGLHSSDNNDILSAGIDSLYWSNDQQSVSDSLFIYSDSLVSTFLFESVTDTFFRIPGTFIVGDYFWRLKSIDAAGNVSNYSNLEKFFIQ